MGPADRVTQDLDLPHQQIGAAVQQVHRKEEGSARNLIAAIFRHEAGMPAIAGWRNALRFSALRMLPPWNTVGVERMSKVQSALRLL